MFEDRYSRDELEWTAKGTATSRKTVARRVFLRRAGGALLGAAFAGSGGLFYAGELDPSWLEVTRKRFAIPRLQAEFHGYRIVHISDLHLDDFTEPGYLEQVMRLVNEQRPDLISFTGDFVTYAPEKFATKLAGTIGQLKARDGVFAVLGNHDYLTNPEVVSAAIREGGARELRNGVSTIRRAASTLHICGVDDVWEGQPRLDRVLARLPRTGAAILLVHEPDFADAVASTGRFDLQLSGHSHGGQIRLPLVGAPVLPRYARKYPMGLYRPDNMLLYTNRGLGMLPPRFRFMCRPEITVLDLDAGRS